MKDIDLMKMHDALKFIHENDRKHINCIRLDYAELEKDYESRCWTKAIMYAKEFRRLQVPFLTQARIMGNGVVKGRADLITLLDFTAYEFVFTERDLRYQKKNYWPFKKIKVIV